jgi:RNA polymerase sigma factor (sigma-70 family)
MNASVTSKALLDGTARLRQELDAQFRAPLMAYFLKRVQDRNEAEDLTQDVFLRLMAQAPNLRVDATGYVFKIAANLLRDRARRTITRSTRAHDSLDDPDNTHLESDLVEQLSPERVLLGREHLAAVIEALNDLDQRARHVFILFRIEKLRLRDIAEMYGLSVAAVERLVTKATTHVVARLRQIRIADQ